MKSAINKLRVGEDDDGNPIQSTHPPRKRVTKRAGTANQSYRALGIEGTSDAEDGGFGDEMQGLRSGSDLDSDEDKRMTNEEVFNVYAGSIVAHAVLLPACQCLTTKDSG